MLPDRTSAGKKLAEALRAYAGRDAVVLALPRGGVVLGYEVAHALALPLDIIAVRKIGHPASPEYAIGAVDERGTVMLDETGAREVDSSWLKEETARQKAEAQRRSALYRAGKRPLELGRKIAIIVDDGMATGLTMRLAVRRTREEKAARIIVAVPVASSESAQAVTDEGADEIVILEPPEDFGGAVGAHYARFEQVGDDEVVRLMRTSV